MLVCNAYIWTFLCACICAFVPTKQENASIRDKKTHVYHVAGMIATIREKKPRVYRVIILKQMAEHKLLAGYLLTSSANIMEYEARSAIEFNSYILN